MKLHIKKVWVKRGGSFWDQLTAQERLEFVLTHEGAFLGARLVQPGELLAARVTPDSARKYIIEREESPFFASLDIKKPLGGQVAAGMLEAVLLAS